MTVPEQQLEVNRLKLNGLKLNIKRMGGAGAGDRELQSFGVGSGTNYASLE